MGLGKGHTCGLVWHNDMSGAIPGQVKQEKEVEESRGGDMVEEGAGQHKDGEMGEIGV